MDSWKSLHETLLPDKEDFCKNLNMENVTNADHKHAKKKSMEKLWHKNFLWISWLVCSKWHVITCRRIWKFLKQICWNIWTWSSSFFICTWISLASMLKKYWSTIRIINWYWYVLNGRKSIKGEICHSIHRYANTNNKYVKGHKKDKE